MTVNTKYEVGLGKAYWGMYNNKPTPFYITSISIAISHKDKVTITYGLGHKVGKIDLYVRECSIFDSKEALLASL